MHDNNTEECRKWLGEVVAKCGTGSRELWISIALSWAFDKRYDLACLREKGKVLESVVSHREVVSKILRSRVDAAIREAINNSRRP